MNKRGELLKEREKLKEIEDEMKKEAEAVFKDFRPKYQYKITKDKPDKRELIFYRGYEVDTIIKADIRPAPGVMHEYTGLHLMARKIAPYMRLNLPVLSTIEQTFLVSKEGKIMSHSQSYGWYDLTLTRRSMCIEPTMRVWIPSEEKIGMFVEMHNNRVARIEDWIRMEYPDRELVWIEEIGEGEIVKAES